MATWIAKENKCATVWSNQAALAGYAEDNKYCRIGTFTFDGSHGRGFTYLDFDFSGIPEDATIISATLYYYSIYGMKGEATAVSYWKYIALHQVTQEWDESITWNTKPNTSKVLSSGDVSSGQRSIDITSMVQSWFNGTAVRNGICFLTDSNAAQYGNTYFDIYNHYSDNAQLTAYIEINYIGQQMYKIAEPRIREIGDQVRRISGTTDYMTVEEMVNKLTEYELGDGLPFAEVGVF